MKSHGNPSYCRQNQGFAIFSSSRLWSSIGDFGGLHSGSLWPPSGSKDGSKTTQGASKTPLTRFQCRPSTSQDASKTAQDAPKALQEPPRRLSDPPRALQRRFLKPQAVSKSSLEELPKPPAFALPPLASTSDRGRRNARSD